jgi:hypothetical protein
MKRPAEFDPARAQVLLAYLRQGGFPLVAADAAGVPAPAFLVWMQRGESAGAREPLRGFARNVRQAVAQARLLAELAVCKKDPKFWLSHGPGRETPESTGWTAPARPATRPTVQTNSLEQARGLCALILDTLTPFPEARARVAERLLTEPAPAAARPQGNPAPTPAFHTLPPRWGGLNPSMN